MFYENEGEEEIRLSGDGVHQLEFLTATKYLDQYLAPHSKVLDSCAGSGIYSFYLAGKGHEVTAGDIVRHNVDVIREKQRDAARPKLFEVYCGDASSLAEFSDKRFDAVLLMGALYHLENPDDRKRAIHESLRLLKDDGLFICTYMNRHAVIYNNVSGGVENIDEVLQFLQEGKEGIFYATTPAEIQAELQDCRIEQVCHVALDGMACLMRHTANLIDDAGLKRWTQYHFASCEEPSLLGCSYHNMFIGRKSGSANKTQSV